MSTLAISPPRPFRQLLPPGRMFVHPAFDYLAIGGGLSLLVAAGLLSIGQLGRGSFLTIVALPYLILAFNSAHFAASTLRLYTKPGAFRDLPFLTMGFPLLALALLSIAVALPDLVGRHLYTLYLTWSPYHYAAQAFGLATMYCHRSGLKLGDLERRLLWWTCMLPFAYALTIGPSAGIRWLVPGEVFLKYPSLQLALIQASAILRLAVFAAPLALAARLYLHGRSGLPAISWLIVLANGFWWVVFVYLEAFVWATVFHGLQYLAITAIFHVKDRTARPENRHGRLYHVVWFYLACLGLGYLIFYTWPFAYVAAGFSYAQSLLIVAAAINVHHFIVDAYIWRVRRDASNRSVVSGAR